MRAEEGELFSLGLAGADGEAARAEAEDLPFGAGLEVARAGEDGKGGESVRLVEVGQGPEAGELERRVRRWRRHVAEGEERRVVGDLPRLAPLDQRDLDRDVVDEARVQEFDREAGGRINEEALVLAEADLGVVLGRQAGKRVGGRIGPHEGLRRERARPLEDHRAVEGPGVLGGHRPRGVPRRQRERGGAGQELPTAHHAAAAVPRLWIRATPCGEAWGRKAREETDFSIAAPFCDGPITV